MHHKPVRRTRRSRGISRPTIAATDRIDLTDRISGRKIAATDRNGGFRLSKPGSPTSWMAPGVETPGDSEIQG